MGHYDKQREEQAVQLRALDRQSLLEAKIICPIQQIKKEMAEIRADIESLKGAIKYLVRIERISNEDK